MQNLSKPLYFPDPACADHDGLVAVDPRLNVERLIDAYSHGIFPWPSQWQRKWFVGWYSPDPRAILPLSSLHVPERLERKLRTEKFRFTWNNDFDRIIEHCASVGDRPENRWLSSELIDAMKQMHRQGYACSIEVYHHSDNYGSVCAGLYGVACGGVFSAESMFHFVSDASKAAVCALVALLRRNRFEILDIQQASRHLASLGAVEISRNEYLVALSEAANLHRPFEKPPQAPVGYGELLPLPRPTTNYKDFGPHHD